MEHSCAKTGFGMFLFGLVVGILFSSFAHGEDNVGYPDQSGGGSGGGSILYGGEEAPQITQCVIVDLPYIPIPAGDFDGDGKDDLIIHCSATGRYWIWLMNGCAVK